MVRAELRAIASVPVGCGVVHFYGVIQGSVVGVGPRVEQYRGKIEPDIDDRDRHCGRTVAVDEAHVGAGLNQALRHIFATIATSPHPRAETSSRMVGIVAAYERRDAGRAIG